MFCFGQESCYGSKISSIKRINAYGTDALSGTTIISNVAGTGSSDNTLFVEIYGTMDELFNVYCNSSDVCKIDCQSSEACSKMYLHCFGTCYVRCNDLNGIDCPVYGVYSYWTTLNPTNIPSQEPTNFPTLFPTTNNPTVEPSEIPTSLPTSIPTVLPTNNPTNYPTSMPSAATTSTAVTTTITTDTTTQTSLTMPTIMTTVTTQMAQSTASTEFDGTRGGNNNNNNGDTNQLTETTINLLIVCVFLLLIVVILALIFLYTVKNKRKEIAKKQEINKNEKQQVNNVVELNKLHSLSNIDSNSYPHATGTTSAVNVASGENGTGATNLNMDAAVIFETLANAQDAMIEDLFSSHGTIVQKKIVNTNDGNERDYTDDSDDNNNNNNDNNDELVSEGQDGNDVNGTQSNRYGSGKETGSKYQIDESKYQEWTQKEVIMWLKLSLAYNGIESDVVKQFLKEFNRKYVTGRMIEMYKNDQNGQLLDQLRLEFSKPNQVYGIWMVIKSNIQSLGGDNLLS